MNVYVEAEKERNHLKKRGLKTSKLERKDGVLLAIYYLRHYPTFANLAHVFEISESYCHKLYSRYARILVKVETLPLSNKLLENPPNTLIIDVTSPPIERPIKDQKSYYSGKKKRHTIKAQLVFEVNVFAKQKH